MPDYTGKKVGNYTIVRKLGEGGFATVYLAQHNVLDKKAAVKFLLDDWISEPDVVARFFDEARTMEKLHGHPNVIPIIDIATKEICDREGVPPYFIMDYVDGATLEQKIHSDEAFTLDFIFKVALDTLGALDFVHKRGVVHRDIKPSNILIRSDGTIVLTDFGIAKAKMNTSKTGEGIALGSTDYMSPEQALGNRDLDHRSDIYSFGITLYEMVVGKLPFIGDNPNSVAIMHIQQEPIAPISHNDAVPGGLNAVILKAMAKKPEDRFPSVADMIAAVENAKTDDGSQPVSIDVPQVELQTLKTELPEDAIRTDEAAEAVVVQQSPPHLSRIGPSAAAQGLRTLILAGGLIAAMVGVFMGGFYVYNQMTVGKLEVVTEPSGASVLLEGTTGTYVGTSPAVLTGIVPGDYRLTLSLPGFPVRRELVSVAARETASNDRNHQFIRPQPDALEKLEKAIAGYREVDAGDRNPKTRPQRLAQALLAINQVVAAYPGEEKLHLAFFKFCQEGSLLPNAERVYTELRTKYPNRLMPKLFLGWALVRLGRPKEAVNELDLAFQADHFNIHLLNALGECFEKTSTPDSLAKAKSYYKASLSLEPDQEDIRARIGP